MTRQKFLSEVSEILRLNEVRKPVSATKQTFYISDDEGNSKEFVIKKAGKKILYNRDDVENILEACLLVIKEALKRGEPLNLKNFGKFTLKYRKSKPVRTYTGEMVMSQPRYYIYFSPAPDFKKSAEVYGAMMIDQIKDIEEHLAIDNDEDGDE